jgi:hypothetical protein
LAVHGQMSVARSASRAGAESMHGTHSPLDWQAIETAHAAGRTLTVLWLEARARSEFGAGYPVFLKRRKSWRAQLEAVRRARSEGSGGPPETRFNAGRPLHPEPSIAKAYCEATRQKPGLEPLQVSRGVLYLDTPGILLAVHARDCVAA